MKALKKELQSVAKALKSLTTKTERMSKRIDKLAKAQAKKKAKARPKPRPKKKARVKARRPVKRKVARKKAVRKVARKKAVRKVARKKAPARKKAKATGSDAVLNIIKRSKKGVGTAVLKQKTGFKEKKIRDTIYRLKKQRKIKSVQKGFYVAI